MKKLLLLFALLLSMLGCAPELVAQDEKKRMEIKDSILGVEPGSKDTVWLEEEK